MVFSDETYDQFLYEGEHVSISTLPGMKERTVVINSASKVFSMTGWRVGYAIGPKELMRYVNKVHQNMSTCATSFVQVGVAEAYLHGQAFTEGMVKEFKARRDLMVKGLSAIPGFELVVPKGAFYMLPRITKLGVSPRQFCMDLLDKTGVATVPGDAFGNCGAGFIRLSYAVTRDIPCRKRRLPGPRTSRRRADCRSYGRPGRRRSARQCFPAGIPHTSGSRRCGNSRP